ncbi:AraC family transcriptional regulator [Shewanella decolorationis]|uniref:AraC family transcriptional regulator n=1 Tax=Shewanella decolorationis TaxID=256839 RepID=A0A5B8QY10_9GAMM|nr:AraC family transcriptional regulator [Shewanella decolorationis]QDZ91553.1 AraC family transcriptional regulator [Shewanella decolorationis]
MNTEHAAYHIANELGGLELLNARYHKQNFSRHTHEGYTVGVIETGAQRFYRTGGNHVAPKHSIILVNADEVHNGCSATEDGWSYRAMYPVPAQFANITQELTATRGAPYFPQPVVQDPELAELLRLTFSTLDTSDNRLLRESLVYSSLTQLMARHGRNYPSEHVGANAKPALALVKSFIDDHPAADISLEELATLAGLSPYYLLRQFQRCYGLPPHAYQTQARVRLAKQKIGLGIKLLDVAMECGFHDQSHLNRHFKKTVGITPGQFAKGIGRNIIQA